MTLQDIKQMDKLMITPAEAAPLIGCDPQLIRVQAQDDPRKLGFPVIVIGRTTKIPRLPFITFIEKGYPFFREEDNEEN